MLTLRTFVKLCAVLFPLIFTPVGKFQHIFIEFTLSYCTLMYIPQKSPNLSFKWKGTFVYEYNTIIQHGVYEGPKDCLRVTTCLNVNNVLAHSLTNDILFLLLYSSISVLSYQTFIICNKSHLFTYLSNNFKRTNKNEHSKT